MSQGPRERSALKDRHALRSPPLASRDGLPLTSNQTLTHSLVTTTAEHLTRGHLQALLPQLPTKSELCLLITLEPPPLAHSARLRHHARLASSNADSSPPKRSIRHIDLLRPRRIELPAEQRHQSTEPAKLSPNRWPKPPSPLAELVHVDVHRAEDRQALSSHQAGESAGANDSSNLVSARRSSRQQSLDAKPQLPCPRRGHTHGGSIVVE